VLHREGYEPQVIESSPGRGNVVARYPGSGRLAPLLLYGHTDVVTAEPQHWTHGPFSGDLADGCVWGRGALDMKSMVVQELMVMLLLQRSGIRLDRDVIFAATADEEVGGTAGIGYLVERHRELIQAEYGLSEGGGTTMYIAGKPFYDVRTAEKGTCRFKITARGAPGHGSVPRPDTSILKLMEAVRKLSSIPLPFRPTPTLREFFAVMGLALGVPRDMRELSEGNLQRVTQALPADLGYYLHAITHDTAVPTGLRAGQKINVIPGEAEAWIDGRYLPGQTAEGFLAEVRQVIGSGYEIERVDTGVPLEDPPGGPLYETIVSVVRRYAPDAIVAPIMLSGATDAKHVARMGTKCLGFGPLRVSDTFPLEHLIHGHDERIPIEGFVWGVHVMHDIVKEFCRA
jgi:acetylornithine deacetylase/succinyl-diaminopimelate desuccinylase-like protein